MAPPRLSRRTPVGLRPRDLQAPQRRRALFQPDKQWRAIVTRYDNAVNYRDSVLASIILWQKHDPRNTPQRNCWIAGSPADVPQLRNCTQKQVG